MPWQAFPFLHNPMMLACARVCAAESATVDCRQITALGHSAGAHLWFMALLGRTRAARQRPLQYQEGGAARADARMPARFIGMAGVYDIGQHYQYEAARGTYSCLQDTECQRSLSLPLRYQQTQPNIQNLCSAVRFL